ncbi:acyl-CoA-binding protein [Tenacibaculum sp. UWU-22]|uniref:acyl-CoA-binding protein n=1 Tax=Tenacibaculum sp. UWU-22 TaxID=3234187 RepID=UPI0034DB0B22
MKKNTVNSLDVAFNKAFEKASNTKVSLPPDTMLQLYAYYKQATAGDNSSFNTNYDVRSAFKFNAWIQMRGMSKEQAKKEYINLVNKIIK